jgi:activator of HSP90 ATPase
MLPTIEQSVYFAASARELYNLFINPKRHAAFTGGAVKISPKPGSKFSAFNGLLGGTMLYTIPGQLIVQRWRATHWPKTDADSILILTFTQDGQRGRIDLAHVNVPKHDHAGVTKGWKQYYWKPLKAYLKTAKSQVFSMEGME